MTQAMLSLPIAANVPRTASSPEGGDAGNTTWYLCLPCRTVEVPKTSASSSRNSTNSGVAVFNHAG